MILQTTHGRTVIKLRPNLAPKHVERIETLAKRHFYDGVAFHRVIEGFMAQAGDPTGTGRGKSDLPDLPAEFSKEKFVRGTVGMARGPDPNSANCQFFICVAPVPRLDENYTIWGEVVSGMEAIDAIKKGSTENDNNGIVTDPDHIITLRVEDDPS